MNTDKTTSECNCTDIQQIRIQETYQQTHNKLPLDQRNLKNVQSNQRNSHFREKLRDCSVV